MLKARRILALLERNFLSRPMFYAKVQARRRTLVDSEKWVRVDPVALWRFAEAWVKVKHKLVPSLPIFIDGLNTRPYTKRSPLAWGHAHYGPADFSTNLRTWRRELGKFTLALKRTDLSIISP